MLTNAGIYALASLDGRPLPSAVLSALGLPADSVGLAAHAIDLGQPNAASECRVGRDVTIFLGFFDEAEALSTNLGLTSDASPAAIAARALDRFGANLPNIAVGEWSLLDWRPGRGLTLMSSAARRDSIFYTKHNGLVAVAPSIHTLRQLSFIRGSIDEVGFLSAIANYRVRETLDHATILRDVGRLPPGGSITLFADGERTDRPDRTDAIPRTVLTIHEAVEAAEALLRKIVGERLSRFGIVASLLSGGLDSALIAWLLSENRASSERIDCLCSAAPPGSGLKDEAALARTAADHLSLRLHTVIPENDMSPFTPAFWRFRQGHGPVLSLRHYLYDALGEKAAGLGHSALFDGVFGELTVTGMWPLATPRLRLRQMWRYLQGRPDPWKDTGIASFVRLAPHLRDRLNRLLKECGPERLPIRPLSPSEPWTQPPGEVLRTGPTTELLPGRVRFEYPFRDQRLWRLFSSFPAGFLEHDGLDRAPARLMLSGHLPDSIRLQRKGLAFSPDSELRLRHHAPAARARVKIFRQARLDDWLDLDWLAESLGEIAEGIPKDLIQSQTTQLTAMTAEFLLWWHEGEG